MIPVYKPYLPEKSLRHAHDALDSGWLSQGPYLNKAREALSEIWNTEYIVLTNSGTAANHMMARTMRVKYPERRNLIVPNNSYVAAYNPFILEDYYLDPKDACIDTWNMVFEKTFHHHNEIEFQEHRSNMILVVHNLGNIMNVPRLRRKYPNTPILEDNCEGFGGRYEGHPSGTASDCFSVSFYGNKNITTGEGGAFITYDPDVYDYAHVFHGQGQSPRKFVHNIPGFNYRMNNVQAAILLGQLEVMDEILELKEEVFLRYKRGLYKIEGLYFQQNETDTDPSNWMFGVGVLNNPNYLTLEKFMYENGIEVRPMFYPIRYHKHLHPKTNRLVNKGTDETAVQLSREVVILPSFPELTIEDQDYIIGKVKEYVQKIPLL